jgi:hypothetical protein
MKGKVGKASNKSGVVTRSSIPSRPLGMRPKTDNAKTRVKFAAPKGELGLTIDLTFHFSARHPTRKGDLEIKGSRHFKDVEAKDYLKLFLHKCEECSKLCDFETPEKDEKAKITKTQLLRHLNDCFSKPNVVAVLTLEAMKEFYAMLSTNLFRRLPDIPIRGPLDANDTVFDMAWPHLLLCYQLILTSITVPHTQACLTPVFLTKLIGNGLCLDDNEKAMVRDVLVAVYTRFINLRSTIRTALGCYFAEQQCSRELLQFFATCVNSFNSPLKPEHLRFFTLSLNPLHGDPKMFLYIDPLLDCLNKMIAKQPSILGDVFKYMVKHWPCGERAKQLTYLDEVKNLMLSHTKILTPDLVKLAFQVMAFGAYNESSDVCDYVLLNLTDNKVIDIILTHSALIYPLIFEQLCRTARNHWDEAIRTNTFVALQALQAIDPVIFKKMNEERGGLKKMKTTLMSTFQGNWMQVFQLAKANDNSIQVASFENVLKKSVRQ